MVQVTTAVKDHCVDSLVLGALGNGLANLGCGLTVVAAALKSLLQGGSGNQGAALHIVNDLRIDVGSAAEHVQTGSLGCAGDFTANARVTLLTLSVSIGSLNHLGTPLSYFFTPVLPSLRRMTSSVYLIPLPL